MKFMDHFLFGHTTDCKKKNCAAKLLCGSRGNSVSFLDLRCAYEPAEYPWIHRYIFRRPVVLRVRQTLDFTENRQFQDRDRLSDAPVVILGNSLTYKNKLCTLLHDNVILDFS